MTQQRSDIPSEVSFQVGARTMQMLGRENVSSPIVALAEIVKNAYDADADTVIIELRNASQANGTIRILDDGEGMTFDDIQDKWLVISTDNKRVAKITKKKKRVKVGEKGIGRLGLDRLAEKARVITKHKEHPTLMLDIDWTKYEDSEESLEKIKHSLFEPAELKSHPIGTELLLTGLRDRWTMKMYNDLYSDLSLLVPPFETDDLGFKIFFDCDETPELNREISNPLLEKAEYKLVSTLTPDGVMKHKLTYQRTGEITQDNKKWKGFFNIQDNEPVCGSLKFVLYFYVRNPEILKELNVKRADLNKFLKQYQGIRIYRDSFRVKPYGDPKTDEDWLGLNLMRVKHPGGVGSEKWSLAANQVIGSVFITRDDNPDLQDQTNREGLVQNQAYYDLRNFLMTGINFLERERQDRSRKEIQKQQDNPQVALHQANSAVRKGVERLKEITTKIERKDPTEAARLLNIADEIEAAAGQISIAGDLVDEQQSEKQMMVGLATLGIAVAAFGHETVSDVNMVIDKADLLKDYIQGLPARQRKEATSDLQTLFRSAERVKNWGQFALARIKRSKRVPKEIDINLVIEDILHAFKHALDTLSIKRETHLSKSLPLFYGFEMDIESVFINFITNSVEALRYTPLSKREIQVSTNYLEAEEAIRIRFTDSGKGIPEDDEQKIFSPLYSTKMNEKNEPIGTGMGLTIVRDAVQGYSGEVRVKGKGKLGGAEFEILLPNPKDRLKGKD